MTSSETTSAGSFGKVMFSDSVTGEEMVKSVPIVIGTWMVWPGPIVVTVLFDAVKVVVPLAVLPPRSCTSPAFWLASTGSPVVRVGSLLTTE